MATLLVITSNPQAFASGTWPSTAMNGAVWRFAFTFTSSSASGAYSGYHALFTAPNGGNSGGLWIATDTLEFYNLADQILTTRTMAWSAGATLRLTFDMVAKTITIAGVTSGNGTISWSGSGPYFNGLDTLTAGGLVGEVGYDIAGAFGNIDDGTTGITVDSAAVAITASSIGLRIDRRMVVDSEAVAITAADAGLLFGRRLALDADAVAITPANIDGISTLSAAAVAIGASDIGLLVSRRFVIEAAAVAISTSAIGGSQGTLDPWSLVEDALYAWVVAGSRLDEDHVIWSPESADGQGPAPSGTYIALRILGTDRVSDDQQALTEVAGQIHHGIRGARQSTLELTCFAGAPHGPRRASQILDRVLASIKLPSIKETLRAGNVGIGRRGKIRVANLPRGAMFDPRAIVEVGLHTMTEISEPGYAIERVEATQVATGAVRWTPQPP